MYVIHILLPIYDLPFNFLENVFLRRECFPFDEINFLLGKFSNMNLKYLIDTRQNIFGILPTVSFVSYLWYFVHYNWVIGFVDIKLFIMLLPTLLLSERIRVINLFSFCILVICVFFIVLFYYYWVWDYHFTMI